MMKNEHTGILKFHTLQKKNDNTYISIGKNYKVNSKIERSMERLNYFHSRKKDM